MASGPSTTSRSPPAAAPRLSIVVLPFTNLSDDPEQQYFADGITEDLTTDLSRIAHSLVISRNTAFTYRNRPIDTKQIGRELGVRYVLEGSVRKAGGHVRITAQLIDAVSGAHLWADRFDGLLEDIFELQDNVASSAAGVIEPTLQAAELRMTLFTPPAIVLHPALFKTLPDPPPMDERTELVSIQFPWPPPMVESVAPSWISLPLPPPMVP